MGAKMTVSKYKPPKGEESMLTYIYNVICMCS